MAEGRKGEVLEDFASTVPADPGLATPSIPRLATSLLGPTETGTAKGGACPGGVLFKAWIRDHYPAGASAAGLGHCLLQACFADSGSLGELFRLHAYRPHGGSPLERQRDLLPLPVPREEWARHLKPLLDMAEGSEKCTRGRLTREDARARLDRGMGAWFVLMIILLN